MYVTSRQLTLWIILYQLGSSMLIIPAGLAAVAKQDAWLAVIIAIAISFLFIPLYVAISNQMKMKSVFLYFQALFGNVGGRTLLSLFIFMFPFLIFILTLRNLGDFVTTSIIPQTPAQVIYAIMLFTVVYALYLGIQPLVRSVEIFFPLAMFLMLILIVSVIPNYKVDQILPVLEHGWKPPIRASLLLAAFPFMESVLLLFFVPFVESGKILKKILIKSTMISGIFFFIITGSVLVVLSPELTENLVFPSYFVIRTISFASFYERFEVLVAVIWFISMFCRLSLLMYISAKGLSESLSIKNYRSLLIPLSGIAFIMADVVWPNLTYLNEFITIWPSYAMVFGYVLPILLWVIGRIKTKQT
ncbi:GerAB/ArcD/ProY family transporter [Paenibacillus roseipurpureus]|uniref:Endospore germination permease n=1 Tax=Paenibacillus roseopurpureus TaxID=2918901 RepID=A0AA96LQE6_9BACL|nr:endospore germination permease [Paenibacillus sp. MBLB1832]WNR46095.1 endospore germination permease [Paenibacillus sp. MBLB1832]